MTQRQRRPTIEEIQADPRVSEQVKEYLDTFPTQELKPKPFVQWARRVFTEGRRLGHDDREIATWVRIYRRRYYWSSNQINAILDDIIVYD